MSGRYSNLIATSRGFLKSQKQTVRDVIEESRGDEGPLQSRLYAQLGYKRMLSMLGTGLWQGLHSRYSLWGNYNEIRSDAPKAVIEILSDPDFLKLFDENMDLFQDVIEKAISSGIELDDDKRAEISKYSAELVKSVSDLLDEVQDAIIEEEIDSLGDLQEVLTRYLQDQDKFLLEHFSNVSKAAMKLIGMNPKLVSDSLAIVALKPDDEMHKKMYQDAAMQMLDVARVADNRKKFSKFCLNYREMRSTETRALLDTYAEHYIHSKALTGIDIGNKELNDFVFEGFNFNFSKFNDVSFSHARFDYCNFRYVEFKEAVNFTNAYIDAETFKTMIPSIRHAQAKGINIDFEGCRVVGNIESIDLRAVRTDGLNLSDLRVRSAQLTRGEENCNIVAENREFSDQENPERYQNETQERIWVHKLVDASKQSIVSAFSKDETKQLKLDGVYADIEDKLHAYVLENYPPEERKCLLAMMQNDPQVQQEFVAKVVHRIKVNSTLTRESRVLNWSSSFYTPALISSGFEASIEEFVVSVKNKAKFKFSEKLEGNKKIYKDTLTNNPARMKSIEQFFTLPTKAPIQDFMHYDGTEQSTAPGTLFRWMLEKVLPTFLKPLVYPEAKLGRLAQSRTMFQFIKISMRILFNFRSVYRGVIAVTSVMDDVNMWIAWVKKDDIHHGYADILQNLVKHKVLRKASVERDKLGDVVRGKDGLPIPQEGTVDFLCSTVDFLNDKDDVKEFLRYGYDVLELLEKSGAPDLIKLVVNEPNAHKRKQTLLRVSHNLTIEEILQLEKGLDKVIPIMKKTIGGVNLSKESPGYKHSVPHRDSQKIVDNAFALMKSSNEPSDLNSRDLFSSSEVDFAYGKFAGDGAGSKLVITAKARRFNATSTLFENVVFNGGELSGGRREDIKNFKFKGPNFDHVIAKGAEFNSVKMPRAYADCMEMSNSKIESTNLDNSYFTEAKVSSTTINDSHFNHADLRKMEFSEGDVSNSFFNDVLAGDAVFENSELNGNEFKKAKMQGASFFESTLTNNNFEGADLKGVNFTNAVIDNCSFANADFRNIKLGGLKLKGKINMIGAKMTHAQKFILRQLAVKCGAEIEFEVSKKASVSR